MRRQGKQIVRIAALGCLVSLSCLTVQAADKVVVVPLTSSSRVAALEARIAKLETLLAGVSREQNILHFSGLNVQIDNGTGTTDGEVNGLGNLIIGYNEERPADSAVIPVQAGIHMLLIGVDSGSTSC